MAFANNIGPAMDGSAAGMANYLAMLQGAAQANELLANSNYIQDQQNQPPPAALQLPAGPKVGVTPPPVGTPQINNTHVGVLPQYAPAVAAAGGVHAGGTGASGSAALTGTASPPGTGTPWWMPWQPAIPPSQGVLPVNGQQSPIINGINTGVNAFVNSPTNLMRGISNVAVRPLVNGVQALVSPPNSNPLFNQPQAAPAAASAAPNTPAAPQQASVSPPGLSASGVVSAGSAPAALIPGAGPASTKAGVATPTQSGDVIPRDVRDAALKIPLEQHNYYQEQLLQQRQQITEDTQRQTAYFEAQKQQYAQVQQQQLNQLAQEAQSAQRTGNIGLMKKYQAQAEQLLSGSVSQLQDYDNKAQAINENAIQLYRQNDQNLWQQQAVQAEAEFRMAGDPSRMIHILDAYGSPIQIQDAGDGKYYVIDITGQGTGRRRGDGNGATKFSAQDVSDMFMSKISDAFRQQKATDAAAMTTEMFKHSLKLDEIDAQGAVDIQKKMVELSLAPTEYSVQLDTGSGQTLIVPKDGGASGKPMLVYNPDPAEIPNSGGLKEPNLKVVPLNGGQ